MPYEWDDWALRALLGIEPYEVRQVLEAKRRWPRRASDRSTSLPVLTVWGRTLAGRPLIVALRHTSGLTWKILGARAMSGDELAEFNWWEEQR